MYNHRPHGQRHHHSRVRSHVALGWLYHWEAFSKPDFSPNGYIGLEATLPIEFEVESLRVAVESRLTDSQPLRNRLTTLEELDKKRRMGAQHIEAIQRRRKFTFDKRHKKRALRRGIMVMIQDARKLKYPSKFDAVWLGLYLVREAFPNNSLQLETLNGESFPTRTSSSRCKEYKAWKPLTFKQHILDHPPMVANYVSPTWCPHVFLNLKRILKLRLWLCSIIQKFKI